MKNVLVTGGAGFIGSNFVHHILENEANINLVNLDVLTYAGNLANLTSINDYANYKFIKGNICNAELVEHILSEYQIDTIIHFAAETHVDRSIVDPAPFINTNISGTYTLLECARKQSEQNHIIRFHHISTDEVFGALKPDDPPFCEETPYAPNSPYAASKAASDHIVRSYHHTFGLPVTITNCSNNYGPFQFPEKLIPLIIFNSLSGKPLPIYGDGKQIRDWLYVSDHCDAIMHVVKDGAIGETYCIGGNNQPTNIEIVQIICELLDNLVPDSPYKPHRNLIQYVTDRQGHDRRYAMNINKISSQLGWSPGHSLEEGLSKTITWYLKNPDWIEQIRQKNVYKQWINYQYKQEAPKGMKE